MKFGTSVSNREHLSNDFNLCLSSSDTLFYKKGQNAAFWLCVVEAHDTHTKANSFGASSSVNEGCELSLTCKNLSAMLVMPV